jgi:hypothetical protein
MMFRVAQRNDGGVRLPPDCLPEALAIAQEAQVVHPFGVIFRLVVMSAYPVRRVRFRFQTESTNAPHPSSRRNRISKTYLGRIHLATNSSRVDTKEERVISLIF